MFATGPVFPNPDAEGFLGGMKQLEAGTSAPEAVKAAVSGAAQVPALIIGATMFQRQEHLRAGAVDGDVLGREDTLQPAPAHLLGRTAQDALGPDVPVRRHEAAP
ncbi:hypothetical protein MKK84_21495 [Methylobacterium sp. E-065]|uniref:hypothetical protein n=1 Tax=Methylobacterium sp. E-065 TaxID=2836583 RepID=UPI001FBBB51B|nr:hypothetical protein [Methylobacterium sp. E-065]MCJ2019973.1 hypothetical protein [Methylobacterium sp. E-065]